MSKLFVIGMLVFVLVGCTSSPFNTLNEPPIVPLNKAFNGERMPIHGVITDQDINNFSERANANFQYKIDF